MSFEAWTVLKIIQWTTEYLRDKGIDNPRLDSEVLLANLLKLDRVGLYLNFDRPMSKEELADYREMIKRRSIREPLQYITRTQEFWSLNFKVTPDVLIPRPDTEILVEEALKVANKKKSFFKGHQSLNILDLCTGSGCIAISLACELDESVFYAIDASDRALVIASENASRNGVKDRLTFLHGDLYEPLVTSHESLLFDLIVSNPPYIKHSDIPNIQPEVRDYEPRIAIDGGSEGLDFYKRIVCEAPGHLSPGGFLLVEVGEGQGASVVDMINSIGVFEPASTVKDLASIERVVKARIR